MVIMETLKPILLVKDLKLGFTEPLHGTALNFEIPAQKLIAVIGKNGSGKSTLLSALCGGEGRISGEVRVAGASKPTYLLKPQELSDLIGYVPQEHLFPSHFRVVDLLALSRLSKLGLWGKMPGIEDPEIQRVSTALQLTSLLEKELGSISSGERQRTFLGRAILQQPKVLILDEPTNHLDPKGIGDFWKMTVGLLKEEKLSVVLSTHDLAFVERHADHVLALDKGQVVFNGPKHQYLQEAVAKKIFEI